MIMMMGVVTLHSMRADDPSAIQLGVQVREGMEHLGSCLGVFSSQMAQAQAHAQASLGQQAQTSSTSVQVAQAADNNTMLNNATQPQPQPQPQSQPQPPRPESVHVFVASMDDRRGYFKERYPDWKVRLTN